MDPEVLLWDFGDTLADERWMRRCPPSCPGWADVWSEVMADLADDWNVGVVRTPQILATLAARTDMALPEVEAHARACCDQIVFNEAAWRVAVEHRMPQALVTVNPDLFADHVVPAHGLTEVFDVIVMSYAENTAEKPTLCQTALRRLDFDGDRSSALLIDNRLDLVRAWQDIGGAGYWFQSDEQFARDVASLLG